MSFESLALLLLPVDGPGVVAEASEEWRFDPASAAEATYVVWGRGPFPWDRPAPAAARVALRREAGLSLLRTRPPAPFTVRAVHRVPAPQIGAGLVLPRLRAFLRSGALVELFSGDAPTRAIDAAARAAGSVEPLRRLRPAVGGSWLARTSDGSGTDFVLRVARDGGPADPQRAALALERLADAGSPVVPKLLRRGRGAGTSWSAETALPGRRPARLSSSLARDAAGFCATLPRTEGPPVTPVIELRSLAGRFSRWQRELSGLADRVETAAASLRAVVRHGDFWAGNLLASRSRLSGVLDWDAWAEDGLPGTDLLHLVALDLASRRRVGLGRVAGHRPWRSREFETLAGPYWAKLEVRPDLDAVGAAWWAGHVAATLARLPHLAGHAGWITANVDQVVSELAG